MMVLDDLDDGCSINSSRLNCFKIDPEMAEEALQLFKRQQTSDNPLPVPFDECQRSSNGYEFKVVHQWRNGFIVRI